VRRKNKAGIFFALRVVRGMFFFIAAASAAEPSVGTRDWRRRRGCGWRFSAKAASGAGEKNFGGIRRKPLKRLKTGKEREAKGP